MKAIRTTFISPDIFDLIQGIPEHWENFYSFSLSSSIQKEKEKTCNLPFFLLFVFVSDSNFRLRTDTRSIIACLLSLLFEAYFVASSNEQQNLPTKNINEHILVAWKLLSLYSFNIQDFHGPSLFIFINIMKNVQIFRR